jgi:dephospho-CoA kinase
VVHPAVFADFDEWVASQSAPYILKEAALLFESNSYLGLDAIITVDAPLQVRIERTMQRDHVSEEAVMKRINNQMPDKAKREAADYVIINDSSEPLLPQVLTLHDLWTA